MAYSSVTNKAVLDIQDCVAELKRVFFIENTIINDDNPALHRLEEKLEFILLVGLKEKPAVFGGKLSYWDYISACLSSSKLHHQCLKFVKSHSELKTSLGRGRAFLRFCMMQNCLADTLQSCFVDIRTTRDYYIEHSLPLQHKLWSSLISYLYDLNEINFDLNPQHAELDVSWPSFARKLFTSAENKTVSRENIKCETLEKDIFCTVHDENELKNHESASGKLDEFILPNILDNEEELTSQNVVKKSSKHIEKEYDFLTKDTQCVCDPKTELLEQNNSDFSHTNSSCRAIQNFEKVNLPTDSYALSDSNMQKVKSGLMPAKSEKIINYKTDSSDSLTDINLDLSQSKTKEFNESHALKLSDSTNKHIFEMKGIIDNLSNNMCTYAKDSEILSNFTRLKSALNCLETNYLRNTNKSRECDIHKQQFEDLSDFLKSLAQKQEAVIASLSEKINYSLRENESLYENMNCLKDKLHSYGLLKIETDSDINMHSSLPVDAKHMDDLNWNVQLFENVSKDSLDSFHILKESISKLCSMNMQAMSLQLWSNSSNKLSNNLISRVQDQEIHMKGITKELEEAHHLLSVMRKQHKKLQSAENIIKYDLQEKRKLLTRLKEQLESTHEDCNLVKIKNSKSEIECQNLRKEFALRNKQTSEESGFLDDKGLEDNSTAVNVSYDHNVIQNIPNKEVSSNINDIESKYILKKNRLKMLEEQCKLLCSNLVNSSKKRQEIDSRLELWCEAIENSHKASEIEKSINVVDINQDCESGTPELVTENTLDSGSEIDSSLLSSGIGSVNSDILCIPPNPAELPNMCCSLEASEVKYLGQSNLERYQSEISLDSSSLGIDCNAMSTPICNTANHKNFEITEDALLDFSIESFEGVEDCSNHSQDVSSPELNYFKYIENELQGTIADTTCKRTFLKTDIPKLCEENKALKAKCQELEKNSIMLSNQLLLKSQQLKLTETTKQQEITALQFQLNSEILKYERSLKEFATNNDDLNEMKQKVNDQEELILALEEALAEIQSERVNEKDHQWEQLQDIQLALAAREEECILLSADLEKLEDFKKYCLSDREIMEKEITHLRSDSKDLQKKIIKLLKEKDILWKRNDHLTFLQKIQIDDRWMNDQEVSQCLGCKSHFTFLLRKHHCRQCGRIFCYSCSNNWLLTASSKKQIRICNECYNQHLEIKKVVRRDSNVQCCEDSDDEAEFDNVSLNLNRSFCSANRPSINDSVVSLPVMQATNLTEKRYFTSVPELYMAIEDHEITKTNKPNANESDENSVLFIKAGEEVDLPILNEEHLISLHWKFLPNNEAIPVSLIYETATCLTPQRTVLHQSACETEGVIHLTLPGLYKLHFDNRSRSSSMTVHYTFKNDVSNEKSVCI